MMIIIVLFIIWFVISIILSLILPFDLDIDFLIAAGLIVIFIVIGSIVSLRNENEVEKKRMNKKISNENILKSYGYSLSNELFTCFGTTFYIENGKLLYSFIGSIPSNLDLKRYQIIEGINRNTEFEIKYITGYDRSIETKNLFMLGMIAGLTNTAIVVDSSTPNDNYIHSILVIIDSHIAIPIFIDGKLELCNENAHIIQEFENKIYSIKDYF